MWMQGGENRQKRERETKGRRLESPALTPIVPEVINFRGSVY